MPSMLIRTLHRVCIMNAYVQIGRHWNYTVYLYIYIDNKNNNHNINKITKYSNNSDIGSNKKMIFLTCSTHLFQKR